MNEHKSDVDTSKLGRFDQSFFVRTLISFFTFTLAIAALELGIRLGLVFYEFHTGEEDVRIAAEQLGSDIQAIMLNQGGPVASRTVYPIIKRNFQLGGLEIAVLPSHVTRTSIPKLYDFEPKGIPPDWPEGQFKEGEVDVVAEEFCTRCHVDAEPGDVLGTVKVRSYLGTRLDRWWQEVRLTGAISVGNILLHSTILYFLLRVLLGPLLSLKSAVSQLAKGASGISLRAEVKSSNEFGELAHDLNMFLDRVDQILSDLRNTIDKMVGVNERLADVTGRAKSRLAGVEDALESTIPSIGEDTAGSANLVAKRLDELESIINHLVANLDQETDATISKQRLDELCRVVDKLRDDWGRYQQQMAGIPRLIHEVHELRHMVSEVTFLEEQLKDVADSGERILERLVA